MRDSHATAMPADMPVKPTTDRAETVLPYDPDDWDRRLAEARKRRAAVLAARASSPLEAAPPVAPVGPVGPTAAKRPALVPSARADDRGQRGGTACPDADAWRRKLAEARGLTPYTSRGPGLVAPSQGRRTADKDTAEPPRRTSGSGRAQDIPRATQVRAAAGGGSVLMVASMAGVAGLAAGVALAAVLVGQWSPAGPTPPSGAELAAFSAPAGVPPVTVQTAAFLPPTAPAQPVRVHSMLAGSVPNPIRSAEGPVRHAAPAMPVVPDIAPGAVTLPPPDMPPVATADEAIPFVVVHTPPVPVRAGTTDLMAESVARGWAVVPVGFTVSRSHLRVYHAADRPAATTLGERLGLPIRDFTGEIPAPSGLIEVWVAGGPGSEG